MTRSHKWTPALLVMVFLTMQSAVSWAEDRIGVASSTKPNADGVMAGNSQTLGAGSEVYANETIRTGNLGQADLVFVDKTNLTVGPTSEVLLDKFVYDPTGSNGKVVFQATKGAFRFVTGTQDHRAYAVNTPYGSLGVRGTQVEITTQPKGFCEKAKKNGQTPPGCDCATKVRLVEGQASFRTNAGKTARLTEPNQTVCISPTGAISYGSSSTSILSFNAEGQNQGPGPSPTPPPPPPPPPPCPQGHCQP
jgi:FecR protein